MTRSRLPQPANSTARHTSRAASIAAVLAAGLLGAAPARAEVTPAQATALEAQIRGFIARQIGAVVDASALAVRATPAGDSVKLELPLGGPMLRGLLEASPGAWSARVKPLTDGRYAIEDMRITSPMTFSLAGDALAAGKGKDKDKPSSMTIEMAEQSYSGMLDTTLATTSTFDTRLRGYSVTIDGAEGPRTTHLDVVTGNSVWTPKGGARADVTGSLTADKYATATAMPDGSTVNVSADRLIGSSRIDNLDFDRLGAIVQAAAAFGATLDKASKDKAGDTTELTPAQRGMLRTMLADLGELMDGMGSNQTMENLRVTASGQTGTLKKLSLGFAASAPGGLLEMRLPIALEGFDSPAIPKGAIRELLPKLVSLIPRFAGVPKAELMAILQRAADVPDTDAMQAELTAMVGKNPVTFGIDKLAIELGLASLRGGGAVKVSGADDIQGDGEFRMTGLDALIRRTNTTPELKMAAPALIFLKGIGKADGKDMVWHITYADKALMVNDTNMTEMMPGK